MGNDGREENIFSDTIFCSSLITQESVGLSHAQYSGLELQADLCHFPVGWEWKGKQRVKRQKEQREEGRETAKGAVWLVAANKRGKKSEEIPATFCDVAVIYTNCTILLRFLWKTGKLADQQPGMLCHQNVFNISECFLLLWGLVVSIGHSQHLAWGARTLPGPKELWKIKRTKEWKRKREEWKGTQKRRKEVKWIASTTVCHI